jgi:RNA polymerase sigma-70 factor, ECF subfamily
MPNTFGSSRVCSLGEPAKVDVRSSLVSEAAAGNATAVDELLRAVWPHAYRIAWSVLRERTSAEDTAQEACAQVLGAIGSLRRHERFVAWFYKIVVNRAQQRLRQIRRESVGAPEPVQNGGASRDDAIDVRRAVESLELDLRIPVVLHYYGGLNSAEIAEALSISPVTVRWRLFVARRQLRPLLCVDAGAAPPRTTERYADESQSV